MIFVFTWCKFTNGLSTLGMQNNCIYTSPISKENIRHGSITSTNLCLEGQKFEKSRKQATFSPSSSGSLIPFLRYNTGPIVEDEETACLFEYLNGDAVDEHKRLHLRWTHRIEWLPSPLKKSYDGQWLHVAQLIFPVIISSHMHPHILF